MQWHNLSKRRWIRYMPKRKLKDWISAHLEYTEQSESPLSYLTWAGLSCCSAALQRRVYMDWETRIFPNMYIILIGPSGRSRKGYPLYVAQDYLEDVSINLMAENPTPEAFIRDMHLAETSFKDPSSGDMVWQSPVTCVAEELAVLLGQQNVAFLSFLTNWYDSRYKWVRRTKHQGTDTILGVCLNLLGSSAPEWLPGILSREAIGGGFTSRCIFIVEDRKRRTVLDPTTYKQSPALRRDLNHDLEQMLLLTGEYKFEDAARQMYIDWYEAEDEKLMGGHNMFGDPALNGYAARRPTHLRKIAMALAASKRDDLVILEEDVAGARKLLEDAEVKMPEVFAGIGRSKYAAETEMVMDFIKKRGKAKRSEILSAMYRDIDEAAFDSVITILVNMKRISIRLLTDEGDRQYVYKGD